jgi:hypothetical protein
LELSLFWLFESGSTKLLNASTSCYPIQNTLMKNGFFLVYLLAVSAAGDGCWLGQCHAQQPSTQLSTQITEAKQPGALPSLPPVVSTPATPAEKVSKVGKLSLAEIEAKIFGFKTKGQMNNYGLQNRKELFKVLADVDTADIPQLLAFIDKNLPANLCWSLQYPVDAELGGIGSRGGDGLRECAD